MSQLQTTAVIRQRGQLTVPDSLREKHPWVSTGSVVTIKSISANQIIIEPYSPIKDANWDELWKSIKKVRAIKGKNRGSLSKFIARDRQTRR